MLGELHSTPLTLLYSKYSNIFRQRNVKYCVAKKRKSYTVFEMRQSCYHHSDVNRIQMQGRGTENEQSETPTHFILSAPLAVQLYIYKTFGT